jgi:hypothetical protein
MRASNSSSRAGLEEQDEAWKDTRPDQTRPDQTRQALHLLTSPLIPHDPTNNQRIAYVYKAKREINGSRVRVIWGRISRSHGNTGVVKSKFTSNLPAKTFGASCRIVRLPLFIFDELRLTDRCSSPPTSKSDRAPHTSWILYTPDLIRL